MKIEKLIVAVVLFTSCSHHPKQQPFTVMTVPTSREALIKYLDTTKRVWFVDYINDSSTMVLTDSITKVQVVISLK